MSSINSRQGILQGLSDTLQNMLLHAQNDDWDEVANSNRVRLKLSSQLRPTNNTHNFEEKRLIQEFCDIDLEIIDLAKKARDEAAGDMQNINGRKANVNQYLQNQFS